MQYADARARCPPCPRVGRGPAAGPGRTRPEAGSPAGCALDLRPSRAARWSGGAGAPDGAVDEQDDDRPDDRPEHTAHLDGAVVDVGPEDGVAEEAAHEGADHAEEPGLTEAHPVAAGDD